MAIKGFAANSETLLFLAWASRQPKLCEALIQSQQQRKDTKLILCAWLGISLPPVFEQGMYGLVYRRLFEYRLSKVEFTYVDWAMREYGAVYFKEELDTISAYPMGEGNIRRSIEETSLLWQAITQDSSLISRLKQLSGKWDGNVRRGARVLQSYFTQHLSLLMRRYECPFLVQEFLHISLEHIYWTEIAAWVLGISYSPLPNEEEEEESNDLSAQLAIMQEMIWQASNDFGDFSQNLRFSEQTRKLCLDLADQCSRILREIQQLQEDENSPPVQKEGNAS